MRLLILLIVAAILGVPFGLMSYVTLRDEVINPSACAWPR